MPISISPSASSKVGLPAAGQDRRRQPDAHRAGAGEGMPGRLRDLLERPAGVGHGARALEREEHPGHAPARVGPLRRGGGDVVRDQDGLDGDALGVGQLARQVEVEDVTAVVAVQVQDARAAVHAPGRLQDLVRSTARRTRCRRPRREHRPTPTKPRNTGRWPDPPPVTMPTRPATGASARTIARRSALDRPEPVRVGQQDALEHLVDERARVVDQLLHGALTSHRILST